MKIYIAAHLSLRDEVKNLYDLCRTHGHTITKDWTTHEAPLPHERDEKSHLVTQIAREDIEGVRSADVFIIVSDGTGGAGRYVELGSAIQSYLEKGSPVIYAIGNNTTESVFYYHPSVHRKKSIEEVLEEIKSPS